MSSKQLENKVAIVTGAARGVGWAMASDKLFPKTTETDDQLNEAPGVSRFLEPTTLVRCCAGRKSGEIRGRLFDAFGG